MDALDREILRRLQSDGRATMTDVAGQVGLSLSACHRRVRQLETSGAIESYRAVVSAAAVGLPFETVVFVQMATSSPDVLSEFEHAALDLPGVTAAHRLFGEPDYMLRILSADLAAYQKLYDTRLGSLPGVRRLTSTIVMKRLGADGSVPV